MGLGVAGLLAACGPSAGGGASSTRSTAAAVSTSLAIISEVRIEGEAMAPTLRSGDLVGVDARAYTTAPPQRGDIVIFLPPDEPTRSFDGRIIGIPGDTIEIDGHYSDTGHTRTAVLIKAAGAASFRALDEPYLPDQTEDPWDEITFCCDPSGRATTQPQPFVIPAGQYFVMGDNRNRSRDSRFVGLIPRADIRSKVLDVLRPPGRADIYAKLPSLGAG
jgi:signal peptidase I